MTQDSKVLNEIEVIKQGVLYIQICTDIPPERKGEIPDKLFESHGSNGTKLGKWNFPDYDEYPELKPCHCEDHEGRWHYVLLC